MDQGGKEELKETLDGNDKSSKNGSCVEAEDKTDVNDKMCCGKGKEEVQNQIEERRYGEVTIVKVGFRNGTMEVVKMKEPTGGKKKVVKTANVVK